MDCRNHGVVAMLLTTIVVSLLGLLAAAVLADAASGAFPLR